MREVIITLLSTSYLVFTMGSLIYTEFPKGHNKKLGDFIFNFDSAQNHNSRHFDSAQNHNS